MKREYAQQVLPLIQAWVEGKTIQVKSTSGEWNDYVEGDSICWDALNYERRIKPEMKTGWINIYPGYSSSAFSTKKTADTLANLDRIACIQISYYEGEGLE